MRSVSTSNLLLSKLELPVSVVSRVKRAGTLFIDQAVIGGDIQSLAILSRRLPEPMTVVAISALVS